MQIATILSQIDLGALTLPEFQRGYVRNRKQVRGLMTSLYRKHPMSSLPVWGTRHYEPAGETIEKGRPWSAWLACTGDREHENLEVLKRWVRAGVSREDDS